MYILFYFLAVVILGASLVAVLSQSFRFMCTMVLVSVAATGLLFILFHAGFVGVWYLLCFGSIFGSICYRLRARNKTPHKKNILNKQLVPSIIAGILVGFALIMAGISRSPFAYTHNDQEAMPGSGFMRLLFEDYAVVLTMGLIAMLIAAGANWYVTRDKST
ncbi:MAG: hypothetical protein GF384_04535 [Elusimicrobia bacterium]|nr:hypothetical protein [Elusimicrobiota bacterium]MBD3412111.1 hypothetical protein [Elusimicrobiota bacterium]